MNKMTNEHPSKVVASDIDKLEIKLNYKFDLYYKNFLIEYNGGTCVNYDLKIENLDGSFDIVEFSDFCGVLKGKDNDHTIANRTDEYLKEKRILEHFIVIGNLSSGSLILLNKNDSFLYYWDRDFEVSEGEEPTGENCYYLAKNFKEFFEEKLYEYVLDEDDED